MWQFRVRLRQVIYMQIHDQSITICWGGDHSDDFELHDSSEKYWALSVVYDDDKDVCRIISSRQIHMFIQHRCVLRI